MKRYAKKIISILMAATIFSGCYAHTGMEINSLPNEAAVKIEAGVTITVCNQAEQCIRNFELVSMGSGVVISHHRNNSFVLTAGHVCQSPAPMQPPLMATTPEVQAMLNQIAMRLGAPPDFQPVLATMEWTINVRDTELREYPTRIINIDPPERVAGDLDLCLASSPRINVGAAKIGTTTPQRGDRVYNISSPAGELFRGEGGMIYQGLLVSVAGLNGSSIFSIPAAPGSSGSPIFNDKGEVIGIVSAIHRRVPNYTIGASLEEIQCYLYQHFKDIKLLEAAPRGVGCD